MKKIEEKINKIKKEIKKTKKEKILSISTTANISNPDVLFNEKKEVDNFIDFNIILKDVNLAKKIIKNFDGLVDYFLIDCEIKNDFKNLQEVSIKNIKKSKLFFYKPNDFTVDSLDMFLACKFKTLLNKNILILGAGNIGSKTAIKLSERGSKVDLLSKQYNKTKKIASALNIFTRGKHKINTLKSLDSIKSNNFDILISCAPGIPIIDENIVNKIKKKGLIIDVGIGTIKKSGFKKADKKNIDLIRLSSITGYESMLNNLKLTVDLINSLNKKNIGENINIVSNGIIGSKGDIIVDNARNIKKIFGICNGYGDTISTIDLEEYIDSIKTKLYDKNVFKKIKK